ncbi:MAG: SAM-dependent methyltransferase [Rickettsiella sp.]|nr:SAM-dependent methyltransferase [Rickettsiella sp.]
MKLCSGDLPCPDFALQVQSEALIQRIVSEMQQDETNSIDFARFMALALYEPQLGYYTAGLTKLGEKGDFVTSPEISPLFAQCMGSQCQQVFSELGGGDILEIGAGTGKMAHDLLLFLEKKRALPTSYKILEISPNLKQRQQEMLMAQIPHLFSLIEWLADWPEIPIKGIVIANEVVDALPVHKFLWANSDIHEMRVTHNKGNFLWYLQQAAPYELEKLDRLKLNFFNKTSHYESEVCLGLPIWVNKLSAALRQGLILIVDYGFSAREYYHPERCQGTLMCYYQHRGHTNPFILIGLQDMTASVDFSLLAQCAVASGLKIAGFTSQAAFLINNGLLHRMEECYNPISSVDINRQIYCLTSPNEMGELIKVIGMTREYASRIQGFIQYDKRTRL